MNKSSYFRSEYIIVVTFLPLFSYSEEEEELQVVQLREVGIHQHVKS